MREGQGIRDAGGQENLTSSPPAWPGARGDPPTGLSELFPLLARPAGLLPTLLGGSQRQALAGRGLRGHGPRASCSTSRRPAWPVGRRHRLRHRPPARRRGRRLPSPSRPGGLAHGWPPTGFSSRPVTSASRTTPSSITTPARPPDRPWTCNSCRHRRGHRPRVWAASTCSWPWAHAVLAAGSVFNFFAQGTLVSAGAVFAVHAQVTRPPVLVVVSPGAAGRRGPRGRVELVAVRGLRPPPRAGLTHEAWSADPRASAWPSPRPGESEVLAPTRSRRAGEKCRPSASSPSATHPDPRPVYIAMVIAAAVAPFVLDRVGRGRRPPRAGAARALINDREGTTSSASPTRPGSSSPPSPPPALWPAWPATSSPRSPRRRCSSATASSSSASPPRPSAATAASGGAIVGGLIVGQIVGLTPVWFDASFAQPLVFLSAAGGPRRPRRPGYARAPLGRQFRLGPAAGGLTMGVTRAARLPLGPRRSSVAACRPGRPLQDLPGYDLNRLQLTFVYADGGDGLELRLRVRRPARLGQPVLIGIAPTRAGLLSAKRAGLQQTAGSRRSS